MKEIEDPKEAIEIWAAVKTRTDDLVATFKKRDSMNKEMKRVFELERIGTPAANWIKATSDPSARNALLGAVRLMTATAPVFSIERAFNTEEADDYSSIIERAASAMWQKSGRMMGNPTHFDAVLSGLLYGDIHLTITKTADLVAQAAISGIRGQVRRAAALSKTTPYAFRAIDPSNGYPEYDMFGLSGYLRKEEMTMRSVRAVWGAAIDKVAYDTTKGETDVTLMSWWDWDHRVVWLDGYEGQVLVAEHDLDFIPIVAQITEGSLMFNDPGDQRMPFLYGAWKSGLIDRNNLTMTLIYSLAYRVGAMPNLVHEANDPEDELEVDLSDPMGITTIEKGESLRPLEKNAIDRSLSDILGLSEQKLVESTISRVALGDSPSHALPFQAIALLAQQGRLPLVGVKEKGAWAISDAVMMALQWFRKDGSKKRMYDSKDGAAFEIDPSMIPENIELQVSLEPHLPIDKLQMANIATMITDGEQPLTSKKWARETFMQIENSEDMDAEVWSEQYASLQATQRMEEQLLKIEQMRAERLALAQAANQPQQAPGLAQQPNQIPPQMAMGGPQPPQMEMEGPQPLRQPGAIPGDAAAQGQGYDPNIGGAPASSVTGAPRPRNGRNT